MKAPAHQALKARRLGIDTLSEPVILLHKDCPVCRSEGFSSLNRVAIQAGTRTVIVTLYQADSDIVACDEAGLSDAAWQLLAIQKGATVRVQHAPTVDSLAHLRSRVYGHQLDQDAFDEIITDIVHGRYSAIEMSAFVTACAANPLSIPEIQSLTSAMVRAGETMRWESPIVVDKHSVGGLPGNRTTPIIVAILCALGLTMPKTSSRSITSPAGTADMMETLAPVDLDAATMRRVVEKEGGCIAWGGAVRFSPADDILIRIERALDIDSEGQMIASVLSKKIAAGATHLVIDMPIGPTAKVRTNEAALSLEAGLIAVAQSSGLKLEIVRGDGRQPVGHGMGPALEARDVLAVLKGSHDAPQDLRSRALELCAALLELSGRATRESGLALATAALEDGRAWTKFQRICEAQGGMREPPRSRHRKEWLADREGILLEIDNRRIARLAKLAGAPSDQAAGVDLHVRLGDRIARGVPLCTLHADAPGELAYALNYADTNQDMFRIAEP